MDDVDTEGVSPPPAGHDFEFEGRFRELLPIVLVNLLLTILTLGIFRFWARTRVRRYIWSKARFHGDSFEYTGRGLELFLGFLVVLFAVFLPLGFVFYQAQIMMMTPGQEATGGALILAAYIVIFFLYAVAIYRRNCYRLSRTQWRGIRGSQQEGGFKYASNYMALMVLNIVTLGLASPFISNRLWGYEFNRRQFGSGKFGYDASSRPLYKRFLICLVIALVGVPATIAILSGIFAGLMPETVASLDDPQALGEALSQAGSGLFLSILLLYLGMILMIGPLILWYKIRQLEHFFGNVRFESVQLAFGGSFWNLIKLWIGNLLIIILTFGLGSDFAEMRWLRYLISNLRMVGDVDIDQIVQSSQAAPSLGEGLAEGFDLGGI